MGTPNTYKRSIFAPKLSLVPRLSEGQHRKSSNKLIINVGGVRFETYKTTLKSIPDTRLSWLTDNTSHNPDFDPVTKEYFFDRHSGMFSMILNYYRTGKLHVPMDVCGPAFEEELAYWGLDENQIEPCCWHTYRAHRDAQETLREFEGNTADQDSEDDAEEILMREKFGISGDFAVAEQTLWSKWRPRIWSFLDNPKANKASKIYAIISVIFILTSITVFCLETNSNFRYSINPNVSMAGKSVREQLRLTRPYLYMDVFEYICITFFTTEIIARIIVSPNKLEFFKETFNWIDLCSIIPFYVIKVLIAIEPNLETSNVVLFFNALRLVRIFRILKLTRHFSGLKILGHTIRASAKELLLLFLVLIIGVLIFAVFVFYAEQIDEANVNDFQDIPLSFWWAVVTMTTLGYGDMHPRTGLGYLVGTICAVCGLLMLSLPVPIIVSNFTLYYSHAQAKMKLPKKSKNMMVGAANALKEDSMTPMSSPDGSLHSSRSGSSSSSRSGSSLSFEGGEPEATKPNNDSAFGSCENHDKDAGSTKQSDPGGEETRICVIFTDDIANQSRLMNNNIVNGRCSTQSLPDYLRLPKIPEVPDDTDTKKKKKSKSVAPAASSKGNSVQISVIPLGQAATPQEPHVKTIK